MSTIPSKDGTAIAFDRYGEGPAVVLVGGAFQHRAIDPGTARLAELLAEHFAVFHYDRRGRGDSGDKPPYAVERKIEDLEALINEAGGSAFVFAMSSGGALALEAAANGLAIEKLALYEPPFVVDDGRSPLPEGYAERLTDLLSEGRRGDAVEYFLTESAGLPPEAVAPMREAPIWPAFESVAHTLAYDAAVMGATMSGEARPLGRWASATVPTLVMDGGASPGWVHRGAQTLADVLPKAQRRTLEGQTHDVASEILALALEEFFAV
ncbi:MAG: alpha/beta hydrolase [Actinomycetota bacterium]|nr:alpha/beta hydrolase [Actinomycetota bacterium]